jgi:hypothetical protein
LRKVFFKSILLALVCIICNDNSACAQNHTAAITNADTTNFIANGKDGWQLFNSFVATQGVDSIRLELIIQHDNNITWMEEQYIGRIKTSSLRPSKNQTITFTLVPSNYSIKVQDDGKCYLKFIKGALPYNSSFIIPLKVIFKK